VSRAVRVQQRVQQRLGLFAAAAFSISSAAPAVAALTGPQPRSPGGAVALIARGGGGGGGRMGGGGGRSGGGFGGSGRGGGGRAPSGFGQAGGGFNRGDARPSGGWSNRANLGGGSGGGGGGPSLNRPASLPAGGNWQGGDRIQGGTWGQAGNRGPGGNRWSGNAVNVNRNWNRVTNVNVNAGWARPGWGVARPWNWGWYGGWSSPPWGWWAARTAVWGVGTLASAAIINNAVNNAIAASSPVIVVPNTDYQLLYATVQPLGTNSVSFVVQANGTTYQLTADCQQGLINGQQPQSAQEAEVLNAACQVAFGAA
jgi:hypothetical protein